jgi:hypothetical protein
MWGMAQSSPIHAPRSWLSSILPPLAVEHIRRFTAIHRPRHHRVFRISSSFIAIKFSPYYLEP